MKKLDGKIPGCFKYSGYVTFKVKPQFAETADFTMSKQVRKHSTTTGGWSEAYAAQSGDKVDFVINYKNESQVTMKDVVVKDTLPAGLTYVPGSTVLANGNNPTGKTVSDNVVTATGINIGSYLPGASAWVRFSATVASSDKLVCGVNTLKNTAKVVTDYGNKSDDATVTVEKKCDTPTPVDKDVTVCEISSKTVITISKEQYNAHKDLYTDQNSEVCHPKKPTTPETPVVELPKTGFDLSAMSLIGAGALTYAGYAYSVSRRV